MLNVVLNESEIIQDALQGKYDRNNIITTLNLLLKHYYKSDMTDKLQLREQLLNFLKINYKGYKRAKWEETVTKMVNRFLSIVKKNKVEVKIIDIKEIKITDTELKRIEMLENIKLEKIAFIMLVYAKISNIIMNTTEGWINKSCSMICKEAKVILKGIEKEKIFNELYNLGYIQQRKHNAKTNMKVCYISDESKTEMVIDDFDGVVHQYLIWKGEKWKKCEECGNWIKMKSKKPPRYCKLCAKNIKMKQDRIRMQENRE